MNKKQMSIWYGSRKSTNPWIFKVLTNGSQHYIDKHDARMKKLFDTGKIKEFFTTSELYRLKKEAEKAKRAQKPIRL